MYWDFLVIFLVSFILIYLVKKYASKVGLIDIPNERTTHQAHTARGAGIGFFLAVALVTPCFYFDLLLSYLWSLVAIFLIFIIGVLDDHHDTSPNTKFIVIILATVFLSFNDILISDIGTFFGVHLSLA